MRRTGTLPHVLITGGAGFIGTNLAAYLLARTEERVVIFDNLSRPGVELNLAWLKTLDASGRLRFMRGDVRHPVRVAEAVQNASAIYHLAAPSPPPGIQIDPKMEFDINVTGTVNLLEAARLSGKKPAFLFASSAKVYGPLNSLPVVHEGLASHAADPAFRGVSESAPVDYHCPANSTKSAADQYVREYARLYELPTVALRMSCIAGPGQFGNEGQGWVAHFVYSALAGRPVTIFGDGLQVRDVLHVSDLVNGMQAARAYIGVTAGKAFNIGGGVARSISVREMLSLIEQICHQPVQCHYQPERPCDQAIYISDNSWFSTETGWAPRRTIEQTVRDVSAFWHSHRQRLIHPHTPHRGRSVSRAA
jgi:CDP-paratose 2-epimerase